MDGRGEDGRHHLQGREHGLGEEAGQALHGAKHAFGGQKRFYATRFGQGLIITSATIQPRLPSYLGKASALQKQTRLKLLVPVHDQMYFIPANMLPLIISSAVLLSGFFGLFISAPSQG